MTDALEHRTAREILDFWLTEVGEEGWYKVDPEVDEKIRTRFLPAWEAAHDAGAAPWMDSADEALASLILLDQFPRNLFRGEARAFATDGAARACASAAVLRDFDRETPVPQRQFFYLPFEHSEDPLDQARGVELTAERMGEGEIWLHARVHQEIIARFGRFPYRNAALGRETTDDERAFLEGEGYGGLLRALRGS
ncbi:DUF924 family protein [Rhodobacteraceae bacterium 2CG4]|uniref:DUF924 family protein n=2 Tax=Halovulum marinum TaxID=2662447 RepID=A0A6L5YXZ6_9RHOB|nr:DUF924 family protein [Halovulum marinum]